MALPWILCGILLAAVVALLVRLWLLQRDIDEVCRQFQARLSEDTNNSIYLSTRDPHTRELAAVIARQLRQLREQRLRYLHGDRELKEAVTNISHDLRTPLTAICGYLTLLEREEKTAETARYLDCIAGRVQAMRQLTEELFRYSVILSAEQELQLEDVDLGGALEESLAGFYAAMTERGMEPVIRTPERRVVRRLDRAALARVLGNILSNALKYSDGDLCICLSEAGELCFSNRAAALEETQVGRLFDRFFSVETAKGGATGLGLSIARSLVERMGGSLAARYRDEILYITLCFPEEAG